MLSAKCPGQDRRFWKPEDIFEHECPHCGAMVEFWKTDAGVKCPQCKEYILNPRFNLGCALWCPYAEQCVGDLSRIYTQRPEALRDRMELEVRRYFIGESARLQFTLEASALASRLLEVEKEADPPVIIATILLHDTGYADCKKQGVAEAELASCIREKSVEFAAKVMQGFKLPRPVQDKVKGLIAHSGDAIAGDVNLNLFLDIKELTAAKRTATKGELSSEAKVKLIQRLRRDSSRKVAGSILG